uniref:Similarity n=1 Tax=Microcystis aeruginosa (strain PCC 7806) TaxID=267872 RepID=A8YL89_MICA7|nr:unnamed protein product [Microcystis aeruginosa PCC 7806]
MKSDRRLHINKSIFMGITLTDYYALNSQWIGDIAIRMFFHNDFNGFHKFLTLYRNFLILSHFYRTLIRKRSPLLLIKISKKVDSPKVIAIPHHQKAIASSNCIPTKRDRYS